MSTAEILQTMICTKKQTTKVQKRRREKNGLVEKGGERDGVVCLGSGGSQRIFQNKDDRIAAQKHLGNKPVLVHRLGFLLA